MKLKLLFIFGFMLQLSLLAALLIPAAADASTYPQRVGYFHGAGYPPLVPNTENVIPQGVMWNGSAPTCGAGSPGGSDTQDCSSQFIAQIEGDLASPDPQTHFGAAFVINTMLLKPLGSTDNISAGDIAIWENYIRTYQSQGAVQWGVWTTVAGGDNNSNWVPPYGGHPVGDDVFLPQFCGPGTPGPACFGHWEIQFHLPNGTTYRMMYQCANPVGGTQGLTPPWTDSSICDTGQSGTGGTGINAPDQVPINSPIPATVYFNNTGSTIWNVPGTGYLYQITPVGPNAGSWGSPSSVLAGEVTPGTTGAFSVIGANAPATAGTYTFAWQIFAGSPGGNEPAFGATCSKQITVYTINFPFLTTSSGDVHAGGTTGIADVNCPAPAATATITGGAFSTAQYVVSAAGNISGFGSNGVSPGAANPNTLTFGDVGSAGVYGSICRPDLAATASQIAAKGGPNVLVISPATAGTPVKVVIENGQVQFQNTTAGTITRSDASLQGLLVEINGDATVTTSGANPLVGGVWTIYATGSVTINNDLAYPPSSTFANLPSFGIIATANIDIAGSVNRIDGFLYAGSQINTCIDPDINVVTHQLPASCNNKLVVNGMMMAGNFEFRRTYYQDPATSGSAAESLKFLGQMFAKTPPGFSDVIVPTANNSKFNGELPPLF